MVGITNADHDENLERVIDALLDNVYWAWNYFFALEGLHEEYNASPQSFTRAPSFTTCIFHALFDALFAKCGQLIDRKQNVHSIHYLFKLIRRYRAEDAQMLCQVKEHEHTLHSRTNPIARRISNWRHEVVAHITVHGLNASFFQENKLALTEIKTFLKQFDDVIQFYSQSILSRTNDTTSAAFKQKQEIHDLFRGAVSRYCEANPQCGAH